MESASVCGGENNRMGRGRQGGEAAGGKMVGVGTGSSCSSRPNPRLGARARAAAAICPPVLDSKTKELLSLPLKGGKLHFGIE